MSDSPFVRVQYDAGQTAEEPESVDRLLTQIGNALAQCQNAMERIAPRERVNTLADIKISAAPTVISDLHAFLREVSDLGDRIEQAASRLGRAV